MYNSIMSENLPTLPISSLYSEYLCKIFICFFYVLIYLSVGLLGAILVTSNRLNYDWNTYILVFFLPLIVTCFVAIVYFIISSLIKCIKY
jgi:ABC-type sugar transport system permease subunit